MNEKYPIGKFQFNGEITSSIIKGWINEIEDLPRLLRDTVEYLDNEQFDTPYRVGGWTVRQVIHHLADSHLNAYIRFKLALTEEKPVIKPYDEAKWAELSDYRLPIDISLSLLEALHTRWANLLQSLSPTDLEKSFVHPDSGEVSLGENIGIYAWHGRHHLAHITSLCNQEGWGRKPD
ncbi:YfiT family bacillithiol transferase [Ornithinibacillus sp. 179-J 7C1 HS]|uniref:YfiT family bacillithiol transferase n=1 Tax=Ornithinibacillus sp. 179-J 7C1 HS TaxID=3142384 RepID=UPI00399F7A0C